MNIVLDEVHVQNLNFKCKDLFQNIKANVENLKQLIAHEFDAFHQYHVDVQNCKCALTNWWHIEEHKFPTMVQLAW